MNVKQSPFKLLIGRMWRYRLKLFSIIVFALSGNILMLLGPKLMGDAIDLLSSSGGKLGSDFISLIVILLVIYLLASFFQWLLGFLTADLSANIIGELRRDVYNHLNHLPLSYFYKTPFGKISARISADMDQVNDGLIAGLPQLFSGLVSLFGSIYFMFRISWKVALVVISLTPIIFMISRFISRKSFDMYSLEAGKRADLNGLAEEIIEKHELARTLQAAPQILEKYGSENDLLYEYGQKATFYSSLTNPSTRLVNSVSFILCGGLAAYLAIQGELTVGQVGSLLFYANQFSKPINQITEIVAQIQAALAAADKIFDLLSEESTEIEESGTPDLVCKEGNIVFSDVSFSYVPDEPLIRHLNISVPARSKVAIVGPTGAGKTTLVNLLMRFYEPNQGQIIIDGQNIADVTRNSLRRAFGMVLQEVWLFEGTVFENLTFANPNLSLAEVKSVCKKIKAHSFIRRLENGYDTVISEQSNLSEGQKQLLTVARVMLQNPPMLILDEATSAIDTVTEKRVQEAFDQMMQGRTSFIIAHRLSTVLDADIILVMQDGDIVEQGNFESLMRSDSLFRKLYNSQFEGRQI